MGTTTKQLLPWRGSTLLRTAITELQGCELESITLVLGYKYEELIDHVNYLNVSVVQNDDYLRGLGSSIAAGVSAVLARDQPCSHLLITLADQPTADHRLIDRLLRYGKRYPGDVIATVYDRGPGVPAIFPAAIFPVLLSLDGDAGAGRLLREMTTGIRLVHPPQPIYDIDTPADYQRHEGDQERH